MSTQPNQMGHPAAAYSAATPTAARRGWFSRNWKWFVPLILIVIVGLPVALIGSVFAAMKNSDAAKESVLKAQGNPRVAQKLGTPIKEGWLVSGSINTSTTSGDADLAVPISGSKGQAKIYVTANKATGTWNYSVMEVAIEGSNERINLLSDVTAGSESPTPPPVAPMQPASQPTEQPAAPAAEPPATGQAGIIQSQETNTGGLVAELTECRRHEGVLTIKVRFRNTSNKTAKLDLSHYNDGNDFSKYYVTGGNKKYFILKDTEGVYMSSLSASNGVSLNLDSGQTSLWWAKYPAPSPDVKKLNLVTPVTPPFEDIPITDN